MTPEEVVVFTTAILASRGGNVDDPVHYLGQAEELAAEVLRRARRHRLVGELRDAEKKKEEARLRAELTALETATRAELLYG